jgi:glycosyltransferase involved in cell wall biosynthesis
VNEPLVSVIIPTYNSASTLDACLHSIKNQTYGNIEVIVVDKFSSDTTVDIAKNYNAKIIDSNVSRSEARNIAAKNSKGKFILSIDSDMELTEDVIEECIRKSNHFDSLIIPEISFGEGFWAKCKSIEKLCYIGDETIESARLFKKDIFDYIEGYDKNLLLGEDKDLDIRIRENGFKIGRIKSMIRHNEQNINLWKTMKKNYQYGKTLEKFIVKHPKHPSKESKLIPAYIRNRKLLIKNPTIGAGMLFMKFCEFFAEGIGVVPSLVPKA